jgi:hypothetical protein
LAPHRRCPAHDRRALDLATGTITYRIRERKPRQEFLAFLRLLRQRWPGQKLYLICDNFSPHKHADVAGWAGRRGVQETRGRRRRPPAGSRRRSRRR